MIGTLATLGVSLGLADTILNRDTKKLKNEWNTAMAYGEKTKNTKGQHFEILKTIKKKYGYDCIVSLPFGKSYEDFEEKIPIIQTNLRCVGITSEWKRTDGCAYVRLITKEWDEFAPFEPVKVKPHEVFLSGTEYYKDVISDMRYFPHILVSGSTGSGKSVFIFSMLLNLIVNHTANDVNLYLTQISDKKDLRVFKDVEQVKYYADSLEQSATMLSYLLNEMIRRNTLISKYKDINNLYEYNKKFKNKKLPYIYCVTDEFAFYMPDDLDSPKEVGLKNHCLTCFLRMSKEARSAGIILITGLQRPDKENMPPIFKSLLCTRVAFGQNNTASSLVVIDDGEAVNLEPREAIVLLGNKRYKMKIPYLDMNMINEYAYEYSKEKPKYVDISAFEPYIKSTAKSSNAKSDKNSMYNVHAEYKKQLDDLENKEDNVVDIQSVSKNTKKPTGRGNKGVI